MKEGRGMCRGKERALQLELKMSRCEEKPLKGVQPSWSTSMNRYQPEVQLTECTRQDTMDAVLVKD